MNPFKKIKTDEIKIVIANGKASFSYIFTEKQEKEMNIAAGKIHRELATPFTEDSQSGWKLKGSELSVTFNLKSGEWRTRAFGEIGDIFEEMVK
jgi:hypothetical protein